MSNPPVPAQPFAYEDSSRKSKLGPSRRKEGQNLAQSVVRFNLLLPKTFLVPGINAHCSGISIRTEPGQVPGPPRTIRAIYVVPEMNPLSPRCYYSRRETDDAALTVVQGGSAHRVSMVAGVQDPG